MAERWLSKREIADHFNAGMSSVDRWCRQGMPYTHVGGRRRFLVWQCEAWHRGEEAREPIERREAFPADFETLVDAAAVRVVEIMDAKRLRSRIRRALLPTSAPRPSRASRLSHRLPLLRGR